MIAGVVSACRAASADAPVRALRGSPLRAGDDVVAAAWAQPVLGRERDGLITVLDGVLWPLGPDPLERVAAGWRRQGSQFVAALRGSFTILVWDVTAQAGVLACDHVSMRNCYLHEDGPTLRFSTHLPTIRRLLPRDPGPDPAVVSSWIAGHFLQRRSTMLAGVRRLGNATLLELGPGGWRPRRYWAPQWRGTTPGEPVEHVRQLRAGIERAVQLRADPERPSAVMLSGGFDSSAVAAVAHHLGTPLRTYSAVFPKHRYSDESPRIRSMVEALGVPNVSAALHPQGGLRHAAQYLRDWGIVPGGPGGMLERVLLDRAEQEDVSVVLDGQGGDEILGSSPFLLADHLLRGDVASILRLLNRAPDIHHRPTRAILRAYAAEIAVPGALSPRLHRALRRISRKEAEGELHFLRPDARRLLPDAHDPWEWKQPGVPRWWAWQSYMLTEAREGSQHAEYIWQRAAEHGMLAAAPLLDVDLVDLALSLPPELVWRRQNRSVARAAVGDLLPHDVLANTSKANLGFFYHEVVCGPDYPVWRELLLDPKARILEWADPQALRELVERRPPTSNHLWLRWTTDFWHMGVLEMFLRWAEDEDWADRFLERTDVPALSADLSVV